MKITIQSALIDAQKTLDQFINDPKTLDLISSAAEMIRTVFDQNGRIYACGNGGSMCDAMHFAEEWTGRFRKDRRALPAVAISDPSHLTCVANDFGFEEVFARFVEAFGQEGDLLIAISTSGNSENVIRAAEVARSKKIKTFALTGKDGGRLKTISDLTLIAPGNTTDRIQEIHMMVLHILIETVERMIFPENYGLENDR